jgi:exopolyphosphatase/guanosine-5'-triphosphate,3'-diphosphate pyrophosphatase
MGAVRLTERAAPPDPSGAAALALFRALAAEALAPAVALVSGQPRPARFVGVAGTVTTLAAVQQALPSYDAGRVHGSELTLLELEALEARLASLTIEERARLPGMEPKRADVIVAGCAIVIEALRALGFDRLTVSDRGVRWGLLYDRFAPHG